VDRPIRFPSISARVDHVGTTVRRWQRYLVTYSILIIVTLINVGLSIVVA
jgi:hypothetical protein